MPIEKSEAVSHVTNSDKVNDDLNKTVINESEIKERIISLKPKKGKEFPWWGGGGGGGRGHPLSPR